MADKYSCFAELKAAEPDGAFGIEHEIRTSDLAVIAPHGGKIEPATSEICRAIAGNDRTYYLFEGKRKSKNHERLHITSHKFDEPTCLRVVASAQTVLAIHGQRDPPDATGDEFVNVGGLDRAVGDNLIRQLTLADYTAKRHSKQALQGLAPQNICNRGNTGRGVQLEISRGLRDKLIADSIEMRLFVSSINAGLTLHGL